MKTVVKMMVCCQCSESNTENTTPINGQKPDWELCVDSSNALAKLSDLCARQIKVGVDEAMKEVDLLARNLLQAAQHAKQAEAAVTGSTQADGEHMAPIEVSAELAAMNEAVHTALAKLQFADRLNQRLSNIGGNLLRLSRLVQVSGPGLSESSWAAYLGEARATYSMEEEKELFDAVMGEFAIPPEDEPNNTIAPELF